MAQLIDRRRFVHASLLSAGAFDPASWLKRAGPLEFRTFGQTNDLTLVPLNRIFDERYAVYWKLSV